MTDVLNATAQVAQLPPLVRRRVVVTGLGAITPVGNTAPDTWKTLAAGRSGVAEATQLDTSAYPTHCAAEVKGFNPEAFIPAKRRGAWRAARNWRLWRAAKPWSTRASTLGKKTASGWGSSWAWRSAASI